ATELLLMFNAPPHPAASRTTADGPNVTVPAPPNARLTFRVPAAAPSDSTGEFSVYPDAMCSNAPLADIRAAVKLVVPDNATVAFVVFSSTSPVTATLDSVPPLLVISRCVPDEKVQVPPESVPPVS